MGRKDVYNCDICRDETVPSKLIGVKFCGMKKFKLDVPKSTDGVHICHGCAEQLKNQLIGMDLHSDEQRA